MTANRAADQLTRPSPVQSELDLDIPVREERAKDSERERANKTATRRSIQEMIDLALDQRFASDIGDLLDQVAAVRGHKLFNSLFAVLQRPNARFMLSRSAWERAWHRSIIPNEQPMVLLLNWGPVQLLFDVSQTEPLENARALPEDLDNPYSMEHAKNADFALGWLYANVKHDAVRVMDAPRGLPMAGCIRAATGNGHVVADWPDGRKPSTSVRVRYETLLNARYNNTEKLATLAHELGHLYCGHLGARQKLDWWPSRMDLSHEQDEFEAESVARLVFRRIAPESELPDHLAQYFRPGDPLPTDGWDAVVAAADRIVDMCQGFSPEKSR